MYSNNVPHNSCPNAAETYRKHLLLVRSSLAQLQVGASKHYTIDLLAFACRVLLLKKTVVSKQYSAHGYVMPMAITKEGNYLIPTRRSSGRVADVSYP